MNTVTLEGRTPSLRILLYVSVIRLKSLIGSSVLSMSPYRSHIKVYKREEGGGEGEGGGGGWREGGEREERGTKVVRRRIETSLLHLAPWYDVR